MNMYKKGEETEGILHLMRLVAHEYLQFSTHYEYLITEQNLSRISNLLSTAGRQNKSFNTSRIYLSL